MRCAEGSNNELGLFFPPRFSPLLNQLQMRPGFPQMLLSEALLLAR